MQIKKIIAVAAAALTALSTISFSAFAADTATLSFDTDTSISMFQGYGAAEETAFSASIDESKRFAGNGSLALSENVTESVATENRFGGVFIEASALGLESFAGCTVTAKVMLNEEAAKLTTAFSMFSDGIVWLSYDVSNDQAGNWTDAAIVIPDDAANTRIGFSVPVFESYSGVVAYVDEMTVTKSDGTVIANIGDVKEASNIEVSVGKTSRIILIVVVCAIVIAAAVGVGFIITKFQSKFTQ